MDHLRGAHAVSPEVKTASLGRFFPPWTVRREILTDALKPCHLGHFNGCTSLQRAGACPCSLLSGVPKGVVPCLPTQGLSHPVVVFVSQASAMDQCDQRRATYLSSPAPATLGSPRNIRRRDTEAASPRRTQRKTRGCAVLRV